MGLKTKKEIDSNTIEATKCGRDFQCLNHDGKPLCKIENVVAKDLLFIKCSPDLRRCDYKISFGEGNICFCPTRAKLYKKYRI